VRFGKQSYVLPWDDGDQPVVGDGLSRTSDPRAVLWSVEVSWDHGKPMRSTVRAVSKTQAAAFTKNRHPKATTITVQGKA